MKGNVRGLVGRNLRAGDLSAENVDNDVGVNVREKLFDVSEGFEN